MTDTHTSTTSVIDGNGDHDRQAISDVIERYRRGFATMDAALLKKIWDQHYDHPVYIAQEMAQPIYGQAGVAAYADSVAGMLSADNTMEISDLNIDILGDVAWAFCQFRFEGEAEGNRHIAVGRNTFILHRVDGAWKVIHYHESRPGER